MPRCSLPRAHSSGHAQGCSWWSFWNLPGTADWPESLSLGSDPKSPAADKCFQEMDVGIKKATLKCFCLTAQKTSVYINGIGLIPSRMMQKNLSWQEWSCHSCVLLSERKYLAAFVPLLNQLPEGQSHVVGQSFQLFLGDRWTILQNRQIKNIQLVMSHLKYTKYELYTLNKLQFKKNPLSSFFQCPAQAGQHESR